MSLQVRGRDVALEAYRVETAHGLAFVPECLMASDLRPGTRPSHQEAYAWIAAHGAALERATRSLARGRTPRPPFDVVTLSSSV